MRKNPLRLPLAAIVVLALVTCLVHVYATETPPRKKSPNEIAMPAEYVDLLKKQAAERKAFYSDQAKTKASLKDDQQKQQQALLKIHRARRAEFSKAKHTPQERHEFFGGLRSEMGDLVKKQKEEQKQLNSELAAKLQAFRAKQKQETADLKTRLSAAK
jgi:hypothetical protein